MNAIHEIIDVDVKTGMPPSDWACAAVREFLPTVTAKGGGVVRIVHGYGSTGTGGKIRTELRSLLGALVEAKQVTAWIAGEEWCSGRVDAADFLEVVPQLRAHPDLRWRNPGVTFVLVPAARSKKRTARGAR
jgi:hypothetical protein